MAITAMWAHGTTVAVENPENTASIRRFGWGTDVEVTPGKACWFHGAVPIPALLGGPNRAKLVRVIVFFDSRNRSGALRAVHIWDGDKKLFQSQDLLVEGTHLGLGDPKNTFTLPTPQEVFAGVNIAFLYRANIGIDTPIPPAQFRITSFGADLEI